VKKIITVVFMILIFGEVVYAQTAPKLDLKLSGFFDTLSVLSRNLAERTTSSGGIYGPPSSDFSPGGPAFDRTVSYLATRARLKLDASMSKAMSGTIFFEMDSTRWGDAAGGRNQMGRWSADQAAVEIKNVYIDFALPSETLPIPVTMRVGLQPLSIRPAMVVYTDGMGITAGIKVDPLTINPLWFKAVENQDFSSDDVDVYGLHIFTKVQEFIVGGYGLYYNMNTYPFPAAITSTVNFNSDMWWLGIYADGKLGPLDLKFDFVYDTGRVEDQRNIAVRSRDVKYQGWATRLKVDYPWEKFNFGVGLMYASGSDQKKADGTGFPGTTTPYGTATTKVGSYVIPPGSESFSSHFGESLAFYGSWVNRARMGFMAANYTALSRGAIGGTWFAKLYGSYKVAPWYKLTFETLYIGDTTKNGNTIGNARKGGLPRDDKTIGVEFDLINEISIYKNLKWNIGLGYLFAGNALEYFNPATGRNENGKDPWTVTTRLIYTF